MRYLLLLMMFSVSVAFAQENGDQISVLSKSGMTKVEGKDALGEKVVVVYDRNNQKVYQERILDTAVTYAKFDQGKVVEYGTITRLAYTQEEQTQAKK